MTGAGEAAAEPPVEAAADRDARAYKRVIWAIALAILVFAAAQAGWALSIESRQLFKDATDWGYDVVLYGIAAVVFGRGERAERVSALLIGAILAAAGLHTLYDLWDKIVEPRTIEVATLGFSALSAVLIGYAVVAVLARFRRDPNPLIQATWISARNAAISTTVFALFTFATRIAPMRWPEYALDLFGAALCFQATYAIARASAEDRGRRNAAP